MVVYRHCQHTFPYNL